MKVVLLRHATRSTQGFGDTPLNTQGRLQAESLPRALKPTGSLPVPTHLFCSPKKRAIETLAPLARELGLQAKVDERLDERRSGEPLPDFTARVSQFLEDVAEISASADACAFACTHLDWLEAALLAIPSNLSELETTADFAPASYRLFEIESGLWVQRERGGV